MKTISQIANELGVSRQAVHKRVSTTMSTSLQGLTQKVDGILYINKQGEMLIKSAFKKKPTVNGRVNQTVNVDSGLQSLVDSLNQQLQVNYEQLNAKDEQINQLQKLLENQQVLTRQAQDKILLLEAPSNNKKSFWQRIFGK